MEKLNSILAIVERTEQSRHVLPKACVMARHFNAHLELFLCDAEHAYALRHAYDDRGTAAARDACLSDAHRYLKALRQTVAAPDMDISVDAVCESPLYEGILQKVLRSVPDLVILSAGVGNGGTTPGLSPSAWQVIRTCPIPVMLTHGMPWRPQPRFAAAVDISDEETPGLARVILQTTEYLAAGCSGGLDVLYSERAGPEARVRHSAALHRLAQEFRIQDAHVHVLEGDPARTLPQYAREHRYDLLVLGALTHQKALAALIGTVTAQLVDWLECDFILVKPGSYSAPSLSAAPRAAHG